ncbi:MAG: SymE toxin family protein [Candidatus Methanohalarchaeum thermophilum]|uniref:SymE toxin family protein n=1 Tax=Methanohalarchaeum thermophilum TaxID=1903181 RepID=A0A1Q6DTU3_METT1|nr:MAG: SymE toxin family protein [Candidatus Methanohalarchaeum thermophilum]
MVRKKKLTPSGMKDEEGNYRNAHVNIHKDELQAAGFEIGDEVLVRVREGMIIIQKPGRGEEIQHEFSEE